jgi:hypothetical protein
MLYRPICAGCFAKIDLYLHIKPSEICKIAKNALLILIFLEGGGGDDWG